MKTVFLGIGILNIKIRPSLDYPDSKLHGANMGPTWVLSAPDGPMLSPWTLLSGYLSFKLEIPILVRWHLNIETYWWWCIPVNNVTYTHIGIHCWHQPYLTESYVLVPNRNPNDTAIKIDSILAQSHHDVPMMVTFMTLSLLVFSWLNLRYLKCNLITDGYRI